MSLEVVFAALTSVLLCKVPVVCYFFEVADFVGEVALDEGLQG